MPCSSRTSRLTALVEDQVVRHIRGPAETVIEVDARTRSVKGDVGLEHCLARLGLAPHRALLLDEANLTHIVAQDVCEPWLLPIGPIILLSVSTECSLSVNTGTSSI